MDSVVNVKLEADREITHQVQRHCLIGKLVIDNRPLTSFSVKSFISIEWGCKKDYKVSFIQRNMFLFSLQDEEDFNRVLLNTPYRIYGVLLVLSPWVSAKFPSELQFSFSPFWVQIHGLPFIYFSKENRLKIAELLGKPVSIDGEVYDENLTWRRYHRIRVILDLRKPLIPGFWQERPGLPDKWISFKYEKLGVFCYKCGLIGKHYKQCEFPEGKGCFGPWMRAEPLLYNGGWPCRERGGASSEMVVRSAAPVVSVGGRRLVEANGNRFANLVNMDEIVGTVLIPADVPEVTEKVESEELFYSDDDDDDVVPYSFLLQRVLLNTISALIIVANCIIIMSRVAAAKDNENNWSLLVLMAAYFFYLVRIWRSANTHIRVKRDSTREMLVLLLVFVLLKFC